MDQIKAGADHRIAAERFEGFLRVEHGFVILQQHICQPVYLHRKWTRLSVRSRNS